MRRMRRCLPIPAERSELYFRSGDARCHAWLYMPDGTSSEARPPIIVMAHGLGAVKALRLAAFAERFQANGYACLVFDYRYFGESEGEPRELLSIKRQREDWRAAIEFVRSLDEVDQGRVVLWGTSFGGGHAIASAAGEEMSSPRLRSARSPMGLCPPARSHPPVRRGLRPPTRRTSSPAPRVAHLFASRSPRARAKPGSWMRRT